MCTHVTVAENPYNDPVLMHLQIKQLQQARELAATAEQRMGRAEELTGKESAQRKRESQHRAVAARLSTEASAADTDALRAQRAGALQSAVDLHARCEHLRQLAGAEDACMGRARKQVLTVDFFSFFYSKLDLRFMTP